MPILRHHRTLRRCGTRWRSNKLPKLRERDKVAPGYVLLANDSIDILAPSLPTLNNGLLYNNDVLALPSHGAAFVFLLNISVSNCVLCRIVFQTIGPTVAL